MTDLSFVIVSWNARDFLAGCLESIARLGPGFSTEVIVVDNASADGSAEAVRASFPAVRLVALEENLGFAKANNIGISLSSGEYVLLVNSDVVVLEGCVEALYAYMSAHPEAGLAGPMVLNPDMTLQPTSRRLPTIRGAIFSAMGLDRLNYATHDRTTDAEALSGCFMMARAEAIRDVGGLDERFFFYAEDKDWCKRFRDSGWKVVFYPGARAIHYGGQSSSIAPARFFVEMHKANLAYWRKHRGRAAADLYLLITVLHQVLRIMRGALLMAVRPAELEASSLKVKRSAACLRWIFSGREAA